MADDDDGLQPLFDYGQQAPRFIIQEDSDHEDVSPVTTTKKTKKTVSPGPKKSLQQSTMNQRSNTSIESVVIVDDDSWLPPPPKCAKKMTTNHTQMQIRLRSAELLSVTKKASRDVLELEKQTQAAATAALKHDDHPTSSSPEKKEKIIIKVQDKSGGMHSFRLGTDDRFEKLFSAYASSTKAQITDLVFRFDGVKVVANATPRTLDLENEDIIEVFTKSH